MENILRNLPLNIREELKNIGNLNQVTEIRLRVGRKLCIYYGVDEVNLSYIVSREDLIVILKNVSSNSIYSVQQDINNGFVTLEGGHRIGVVGEVVLKDEKIGNIKNISSMNIRIARQHIGISDKILTSILIEGDIQNTIILSPPLCGKTTLLRDLIRNISNRGKNVCVIDERAEIAPMSQCKCVLDIGERTDVISGCIKDLGMRMAVRSMAPDVVAVDEIGTKGDAEALKYLARSGVKFLATIHGNSPKDIMNSDISSLVENGYVSRIIQLSRKNGIGTIEQIYTDIESIIRP
ncbi:MAG: Flp pilus assembly complex ATPase component TadA [Clostridia bacterium]|nr:Flp pilus assembly complex ATPase component TadA [Clostridia bacterium]